MDQNHMVLVELGELNSEHFASCDVFTRLKRLTNDHDHNLT